MGAGRMAEYPGVWSVLPNFGEQKINVENKENLTKKMSVFILFVYREYCHVC
jgi:hypothetical protein